VANPGFVILASGTGTNARVLLAHAKKKADKMQAFAVISDRADAPVLKIAEEFSVPSFVIDSRNEGSLLAILHRYKPEWACLAGYKKLVGKGFLDFFTSKELGFARVMNVHPSLLPAYPGLHGYERAYKDGVKISGVTVHLVDSGLDTGKIILQESFAREEDDTLDDFMARGQKLEHQLFPKALDLALSGKLQLSGSAGNTFISLKGKSR
jgi:phosphoribosylglycinamide formyltransferase-1